MLRAIASITCIFLIASCNDANRPVPKARTKEQLVQEDLQRLKDSAQTGDLILRAGDDMLSQQIKYLNQNDQTYSHSGLIMVQKGQKMVCDIYPYRNDADTIEFQPIDSFANPSRNLSCALYRYNLSGPERDSLISIIEQYRSNNVRFDRLYDLSTDNRLYCSEMIAKAIEGATRHRIQIKPMNIPFRMRKLVEAYFKKEGATAGVIADRKYISLDNLYLIPECRLVLKFPLKYFPGQ
jgi:hypothetical protein